MTCGRAKDYLGITHATVLSAAVIVRTSCGLIGLWQDVAMSPRVIDMKRAPEEDVSCMACIAESGCT